MEKTIQEPKFDWEKYLDKMQDRGYKILNAGRHTDCDGKIAILHSGSVVHNVCDKCELNSSGFGGPNVHTWGQAVAYSKNESTEDREKRKAQERKEIEDKQKMFRHFLVNTKYNEEGETKC